MRKMKDKMHLVTLIVLMPFLILLCVLNSWVAILLGVLKSGFERVLLWLPPTEENEGKIEFNDESEAPAPKAS